MIRHIVCFKLKDNSEEVCQKTKEILLSMKGRVPQVLDIEVGADFLHSPRSYDIILQVKLQDRDALDAYQNDPYHCGVVKKHMHAVQSASISVDYMLED
ncbi:MAG: Dabb family protein [Clostridiales bacterium]|uniref:Dabb family protein n=1 Tax=Candidatus Scybalenecus merdavium TaxID=2840939 RepID=A0A9D1MT46_9FIRM|nr:Dabb family protein [Clostridiales bacterium]HIU68475.1 Dabb family protein [Candidatus Scubalenecus merdavium]